MIQPTPLNALLLRACAGDATALREWETKVDFAAHDDDGYLLLPLLKHRADANGWTLNEAARIGGFTRYWWTQNSLKLKALGDALPVFAAANIPVIGLDAVALALADYPAAHHRSIQRLDLLIKPQKQKAAYKALRDAGWTPLGYVHPKQTALYESLDFRRDEVVTRLRWYALPHQTASGIDDRLWERSVTAQSETFGFNLLVPCAADRLALRASVIADHWGKPCPALWRADAMQIIRHDDFDWDRAVESAAHYRRPAALQYLLAALSQEMGMGIPNAILRQKRVFWLEKWESGAVELKPIPSWRAHVIRLAHRARGKHPMAYPRELARYFKLVFPFSASSRRRELRGTSPRSQQHREAKETL